MPDDDWIEDSNYRDEMAELDTPPDPSPNLTLAVVSLTAADGTRLLDNQLAVFRFDPIEDDD